MTDKKYYYISLALFIGGILTYAVYQEYIIINPKKTFLTIKTENTINKKKAILFFYKDGWRKDSIHLLLSDNDTQNAQLIINRWLEVMHYEALLKKKIEVQNAFSSDGQLLLSFDQPLFSKESSTFDKWMLIEGILKTLRENIPSIKKVRFLSQHQPFSDMHLDFSNAWPIEGFI